MGYRKVYEYNEGYPAWVKAGLPFVENVKYPDPEVPFVSAVALKGMLDRKEEIVLVDLRDDEDLRAGRIPGSLRIAMVDIASRYREIPKDRKVVLIDLYGKQAYIAARYLALKGYGNLHRLDGGFINGWMKSGYSIEK